MPVRKRRIIRRRRPKLAGSGRTRRRRMRGRGKAWDWIKDKARKVHDFIKSNKLVSTAVNTVAPFLPGSYGTVAAGVGTAARLAGYGRRRRYRRRRVGSGIRRRVGSGIRRRYTRRRMRGGKAFPVKENDLNALKENNLAAIQKINTANKNLAVDNALLNAKPPLQIPGQIARAAVPLIDRIRGALKRTKVISRGARALGANRIANFAEQYGYGRRRRRGRRMRGRGPALRDKFGAYLYVPK